MPELFIGNGVCRSHHDLLQQRSTREGPDTFMKQESLFAMSRSLVWGTAHTFLTDGGAGRQLYAGHPMRHPGEWDRSPWRLIIADDPTGGNAMRHGRSCSKEFSNRGYQVRLGLYRWSGSWFASRSAFRPPHHGVG